MGVGSSHPAGECGLAALCVSLYEKPRARLGRARGKPDQSVIIEFYISKDYIFLRRRLDALSAVLPAAGRSIVSR
jgi:hypothetical protein